MTCLTFVSFFLFRWKRNPWKVHFRMMIMVKTIFRRYSGWQRIEYEHFSWYAALYLDVDAFIFRDSLQSQKNKKEYRIEIPSKFLQSPRKPRLEATKDESLLPFVEVRLSNSELAEKLYLKNVEENHRIASLRKLSGALEFCLHAFRQPFEKFPRWLWSYEPDDKKDKFINMMKYILTDFHLNCLAACKAINDERTPFVEHFIPAFKALPKWFSSWILLGKTYLYKQNTIDRICSRHTQMRENPGEPEACVCQHE